MTLLVPLEEVGAEALSVPREASAGWRAWLCRADDVYADLTARVVVRARVAAAMRSGEVR